MARMNPPENLPNLLVDEGARRIALTHLDNATVARGRLLSQSDPEALHDYRVGLRRLRSCLRAYRKPLRSSVRSKIPRQLRRLARSTNRARDLEVHLAWLEEQRAGASESERPGIAWMIERLSAAKDGAAEHMLDLDAALFSKLHLRLTSRLTRFRTTIDLDSASARRSTAAVTARRLRDASRRLKARLGGIQGYSNEEAIHRARIAAKHLRYLLEPFAALVPDGQTGVERLKSLQDGFGDVHDAQVFEAELREALPAARSVASVSPGFVPGLQTLLVALRARGRQAFERTAAEWLGEAADPFFRMVAVLADAVGELVHGDPERKARSPRRRHASTGGWPPKPAVSIAAPPRASPAPPSPQPHTA